MIPRKEFVAWPGHWVNEELKKYIGLSVRVTGTPTSHLLMPYIDLLDQNYTVQINYNSFRWIKP